MGLAITVKLTESLDSDLKELREIYADSSKASIIRLALKKMAREELPKYHQERKGRKIHTPSTLG